MIQTNYDRKFTCDAPTSFHTSYSLAYISLFNLICFRESHFFSKTHYITSLGTLSKEKLQLQDSISTLLPTSTTTAKCVIANSTWNRILKMQFHWNSHFEEVSLKSVVFSQYVSTSSYCNTFILKMLFPTKWFRMQTRR